MIKLKTAAIIAIAFISIGIQSCKEEVDPPEVFTNNTPDTYNFSNVNYAGQTQRLAQYAELKAYIKTATSGTALSETQLLAMYSNDIANANWMGTYDASKQLKNKTFAQAQNSFDAILTAIANASLSAYPASKDTAGIATSKDQSKTYLLNEKGVDLAQILEKGLMGALVSYQICDVYLGDDKMNVDNTTIVEGEGTTMEHHWDEAFGYFGVQKDFPTNLDNTIMWGSYCKSRNDVLDCNAQLMQAFLNGRAAISNKNLTGRDQAISKIRSTIESIAATSAIHYMKEAIEIFDDVAIRSHVLSEGVGFIYSLQFNPDRTISIAQVENLIALIGGTGDITAIDLYAVDKEDLESVITQLANIYEIEHLVNQL